MLEGYPQVNSSVDQLPLILKPCRPIQLQAPPPPPPHHTRKGGSQQKKEFGISFSGSGFPLFVVKMWNALCEATKIAMGILGTDPEDIDVDICLSRGATVVLDTHIKSGKTPIGTRHIKDGMPLLGVLHMMIVSPRQQSFYNHGLILTNGLENKKGHKRRSGSVELPTE